MRKANYLSYLAGLSICAVGLTANPATSQSLSDITGTNYWNNVVPIHFDGSGLDPELFERINRLNQESEQAFQDCNAAIAQAEQNLPGVRRYSRRPPQVAVPSACIRLEDLRSEAEVLRTSLQNLTESTASTEFSAW